MTGSISNYSSDLYARRDLQNTDFLAFRHITERGLVRERRLLDLGCGAGRSTRFLAELGNHVTGVDANASMVREAKQRDPDGEYLHVASDGSLPFPNAAFDVVFSSWMILEIGQAKSIIRQLRECRRVMRPEGRCLVVTNTPEFYQGRWLSCQVDFPENKPPLRSGQRVRARLMPEGVEISDYFWSDADYRDFFQAAGFRVISADKPLGRKTDPLPWLDELTVAPYVIYQAISSQARPTDS